jgi:DNA (cytosine-5)-methyltransferase 1
MTHGSLFSGIGGFDCAAEWMGWENLFHCEINTFCQRILKYYWPNAKLYEDIKTTDFTIWRGRVDVLSGGFPCQPYSTAGKRKGKEDDRHLWPEMLRAVREISPRYVVGENVRGLTNWNGGLVFDEVQADLEAEGYEVLPFLLPACAVNAPHRRDRIWFIAHSINGGYNAGRKEKGEKNGVQEVGGSPVVAGEFNGADISPVTSDTRLQRQTFNEKQAAGVEQCGEINAPNSDNKGLENGSIRKRNDKKRRQDAGRSIIEFTNNDWKHFPTQSPVCSRNDVVPGGLDGITFSKWRNESIKGFGNAVVPQLVMQIFKSIEQYEIIQASSR